MARYFFHTEDGAHFTDEEGMEFATPDQARHEAISTFTQMLHSEGDKFWEHGCFRLTVTDEQGMIFCVLNLSSTEAPAMKQAAE